MNATCDTLAITMLEESRIEYQISSHKKHGEQTSLSRLGVGHPTHSCRTALWTHSGRDSFPKIIVRVATCIWMQSGSLAKEWRKGLPSLPNSRSLERGLQQSAIETRLGNGTPLVEAVSETKMAPSGQFVTCSPSDLLQGDYAHSESPSEQP